MKFGKIFITGVTGSGKTWLSNKLSEKLGIKAYDLDEIEWERKYDKRRRYSDKIKIVNDILKGKKWIVEGVYTGWVVQIIKKSDIVVWMKPKTGALKKRLLLRFVKNKLHGKSDNLKDLKTLMKFAGNYNLYKEKNEAYNDHKNLASFNKNFIILKNNHDAKKFLEEARI